VKVTVMPEMVVPLALSLVQRLPTLSPAGEVTRYTSAQVLPSDEELADGLADAEPDAVGRADTLADTIGPAEALADVDGSPGFVAAEATATQRPIAETETAPMIRPLLMVRLRMMDPLLEFTAGCRITVRAVSGSPLTIACHSAVRSFTARAQQRVDAGNLSVYQGLSQPVLIWIRNFRRRRGHTNLFTSNDITDP
jgi:hypothetical protein